MKRIRPIFYLLIVISNIVYSYSNLFINDPQRWYVGQGTIEEATLTIQPKGVYFEYNLFMEISARDLGLNHKDTVEIIYNFNLPNDAIVHDSWLWFGDEILKGDILDRWTASQIYESIVDRRQDPSILVKTYDNNYELRVFPLAGDESRIVKLTFLVPANWTSVDVSCPIPLDLFHSSKFPLKKLDIVTQLTGVWENPRVTELQDKPFEKKYIPLIGDYLTLSLNEDEIRSSNSLNYNVDAPFKDGFYLSTFEGNQDNIYQLAYLPTIPDEVNKKKKAAILIDYELSKSSITDKDVIKNVQRMLHQHFTELDSFNLVFSNSTIKRISENWISADSTSIDSVFNSLPDNIISNYSNLPSLLADGIQFIIDNGNNGQIVLLANSDHVGESTIANSLIDDLIEMMIETIPIYIGDYIEYNQRHYYYNNRTYLGNAYFYDNITKLTAGNVSYVKHNTNFANMISNLFSSLGSIITSYDLHTSLASGFCYGRYNLNVTDNSISTKSPILQIGKYYGDLPFKAELNGIVDGKPFSDVKEISADNIISADSILDVVWAGKYISTLDVDDYYYNNLTNQEISEIVDLSIDKRVLTRYTAFLCLEPGMNIDILTDPLNRDNDGGNEWVVDVEDTEQTEISDTLFSSYPNPFNNQTTVKIRLSKQINPENASFKIYNILGQVVKSFNTSDLSTETNEFEFNWNGLNDNNQSVSSGNYFFVMNYSGRVQTLKLILMK